MRQVLSSNSNFLSDIGADFLSESNGDALTDHHGNPKTGYRSSECLHACVIRTEQSYAHCFPSFSDLNATISSGMSEVHVNNDHPHGCKNYSASEQCLLRNDSVTARAISRLSRRVSQLSASTSPVSTRAFRSGRGTHSTKKSNFGDQDPCFQHDSNVDVNPTKKALTGSKRKWQADRCGSHSNMDVDSVDPCVTSSDYSHFPHTTALDYCSRKSMLLSNIGTKSLSMDHLDYLEHTSSGSSMLSVTGSPSNSQNSSQENEADEEDAGEGEPPGIRKISSHSCSNLFETSMLQRKSTQGGKFSAELSVPSKYYVYGGDSSDGLSVNVKIPRLSSGISPFSTSSSSTSRKHGRRSGTIQSRAAAQHSIGSNCNPCHHTPRTRSHVSRAPSNAQQKSQRCHCVHKRCQLKSHTQHNTACVCEESTSSSSVHNESPDTASIPASPESCEDFANDEQSDFPAEETASLRRHRRVLHSVSTRTSKLTCDSNVVGKLCASNTQSALLIGVPQFPSELDSEFEEILKETWPLLSQRAKVGYIDGVSHAGQRWTGVHADSQNVGRKSEKPMLFVPSKLDQVTSLRSAAHSSNPSCGTRGRMPTPPWIEKDGDYDVRTSPFHISDSELASATDLTRTHNHRGLGYGKHPSSTAPPIPESNLGHKLLQRLGWKAGSGLGAKQQGRLYPVGCNTQHGTSSL